MKGAIGTREDNVNTDVMVMILVNEGQVKIILILIQISCTTGTCVYSVCMDLVICSIFSLQRPPNTGEGKSTVVSLTNNNNY